MRVLVVEDEEKVAAFVRQGLEQSGYEVDTVPSGEQALTALDSATYDAVILDLMLPGMDGLEVVAQLRRRGIGTPVLALTARAALEDRVAGLDAGCDDYLPKPFAFDELLARLRALLRRTSDPRAATLTYSGLTVDPITRRVSRDGVPITLTNKEYALLEVLIRSPGEVITKSSLMDAVWGYSLDTSSNVLEVYINSLRKKIDHGFERNLIRTVRGVGYALRDEDP